MVMMGVAGLSEGRGGKACKQKSNKLLLAEETWTP
jgi:hypothetical protein